MFSLFLSYDPISMTVKTDRKKKKICGNAKNKPSREWEKLQSGINIIAKDTSGKELLPKIYKVQQE